MSLKPEPTVVCCNGVCNARILSIVSVPSLPGVSNSSSGQWGGVTGGQCGQSDWTGWNTPPTTTGATGWSTPDSSNIDWSRTGAGGGKYKTWLGSEAGTADSSPQSGNTTHLDMEDEEVTSDEDEEEIIQASSKQSYMTMEQESPQVNMIT